MKTKILSILALLLMTVTQGAWAQETLTVYEDGTKSSPFSPVYMNRFDTYTRSQYIIPAANLEAMNGKIITALKYYSNKSNYTSTCNVDVYLKEVGYTTFDEGTPTFETKSGIVYRGTVSIAGDGTLTITFTTPYTYNGGNLLIGMENTETGNSILSSFYGEIVTGTVAFGSSSVNRGDFIPKTTFTYETPFSGTTADIGKVIGVDGKYYKTKEAAVNAGTQACAIIAYVGSETGEAGYTGGLAIAMRDANGGTRVQWKNATGTADNPSRYSNIADAISAKESGSSLSSGRNNSTTWPAFYHALNNTITTSSGISASKPASGTSGWFLPSIYQWNIILKALSGESNNLSTTSSDSFKPAAVNVKIADADARLGSYNYLSSTEIDTSRPWYWWASGGRAADGLYKTNEGNVRAVFAFNTLTAAEYTVTYNANGGSGAPDAQTKDGGIDLTLSSTVPTRTGYTFAGWNTKADGSGTSYAAGGSYTTNDDIVLYAQWTPTYNATFASGNDNTDWTIDPTSGVAGTTVTVSYTGENKVKSVTVAPKGALTGKFSVSSTSQVQFSKGNLQYVGTWQFAANQYDIFGASQSDNHRDLFGWGTKTNPNNTSTTNGDYSWAEWGENTITNGCTGWRTLSSTEWNYLITGRTNAANLRTFATVNGVTGLILMPDGWTASGVTLTITTANYTTNVLSTSQWATLEKQGCVFLPAAGGRIGNNVVNVGSIGDYWSSDASGETNAYDLNFSNNYLLPQNKAGQRHYGWSVRLVRDVAVKANPSTLAGLKAAINDASDLTDLNTKVLGKYVTATGNIQSTSEGAVGIIGYISKTAVDNSFADSRIFVIATENASNSAAQAPSNAAETTYNSTLDLNGYAVTNAWQAAGYAASTAGWNYSASRPDGASHWFVPSYGQWMLGGWNDGNNRPCSLMRSTMEGSGQYYAVSTAINTEGNDTGYCVDGSWWGMGSIQRIQAIRVRAAFVY